MNRKEGGITLVFICWVLGIFCGSLSWLLLLIYGQPSLLLLMLSNYMLSLTIYRKAGYLLW